MSDVPDCLRDQKDIMAWTSVIKIVFSCFTKPLFLIITFPFCFYKTHRKSALLKELQGTSDLCAYSIKNGN